jgi:prepilin-type N-terminal cleavage/methylation domain-containing protein
MRVNAGSRKSFRRGMGCGHVIRERAKATGQRLKAAARQRFASGIPQSAIPNPHSAFTLVELLVVIAIIGVLVALLLPAVQASREAARRTACMNNLKQVGLALLGYHNARGEFPLGGRIAKGVAVGPSWTTEILPWLEEPPLRDQLDLTLRYTDPANLAAGRTLLPVMLCPSMPEGETPRKSADSANAYAKTAYSGVDGERGLRAANATNNPERGVMIFEKPISLKQIVDGTSHTAVIGEVPEGAHSIWISVKNIFDQSAPINSKAALLADYGQELSSFHPGGALVVFADASVHFFPNSTDNLPLAAICSRDDNMEPK